MILIGQTYVLRFHRFQSCFYLRSIRQRLHSCVINIVIAANTLTFFQISVGSIGCFPGRDYFGIIRHPVPQPSPLDVHAKFIGRFAERRLLKDFIQLR